MELKVPTLQSVTVLAVCKGQPGRNRTGNDVRPRTMDSLTRDVCWWALSLSALSTNNVLLSLSKKKKGGGWNVNGSFMEYWSSLSFSLMNKLELALDEDNSAKSILCGNNRHYIFMHLVKKERRKRGTCTRASVWALRICHRHFPPPGFNKGILKNKNKQIGKIGEIINTRLKTPPLLLF